MEITFAILMFIVGACLGSFLCCQARRLRLKETKKKSLGHRSVCLSCHKKLKWYDNIPILSWFILGGKCRRCHKKIGGLEILSELGMALAFLGLSTTINIQIADFLTWLIFVITLLLTLSLGFLAIYDGAYGELPVQCLIVSILFATLLTGFKIWHSLNFAPFSPELIWYPIASAAILGGLYLALYLISHGKWVGDGDWLLGLAIGLALANPWFALVALFLTNFIACLVVLPTARKTKNLKIHLGPFMVIAFIIVVIFSDFIQGML